MQTVFLAGSGMITPIGAGVEMVNASVQARINRYQQSNIVGNDGELLRMALVPRAAWKDAINKKQLQGEFTPRQRRMLRLATLALKDLACELPKQAVPLFLAGPEFDLGSPGIDGGFIQNLAQQSGVEIDFQNSRFMGIGRAGGINVIETAFRYFEASDNHYAIVGGVDSYYDVETMNALDNAQRLLSGSAFDGFVPGEGAGFLLLISPNAPQDVLKSAIACLHVPGVACEEGHILGDGLFRGDGLSEAFTSAVSVASKPINCLFSSENGEMHYAKELNTALMRNQSAMSDRYQVSRPAEYFGDLGAAFAAVAIGLASVNLTKDYSSLIYGSSDSGARAALCMQRL